MKLTRTQKLISRIDELHGKTQKLISRIDELHGKERGICTQICEGSANNHIRLQDAQVNQFESETTGYDYVICCMGVCIYN
ncbi:hypothetical protein JHK86_050436 [Glycine max]|nr:hypothetical protein JHK86_050436 [Glycine max]